MQYIKLDKEEQTILDKFEKGQLTVIKDQEKEKARYRQYAKNTLNKMKNINIRVSIRDLQKLKSRAFEQGFPYQTIASALLRQYANNKIKLSL